MKKVRNIVLFTLLAVASITIMAITSPNRGRNAPDFSVSSTNERGLSLFYDTLEYMGFDVTTSNNIITRNTSVHDIQIIVRPIVLHEREQLEEWVERGGILVLTSSIFNIQESGIGRVYTVNGIDHLTNISLFEDENSRAIGASVAQFIGENSHGRVIFNMAYSSHSVQAGFWEMMPPWFRLLIYQVAIAGIGVIILFGKRFGKAVPFYEEIEREENEYVPALSNLYMRLGMGNVATDVFLEKFIEKAAEHFRLYEPDLKTIYEMWQISELPQKQKLEYIITEKDREINTKRRSGKRELVRQYNYLNELIEILEKEEKIL